MGLRGVENILDMLAATGSISSVAVEVEQAQLALRAIEILSILRYINRINVVEINISGCRDYFLRIDLKSAARVFVCMRKYESDTKLARQEIKHAKGPVPERIIYLGIGGLNEPGQENRLIKTFAVQLKALDSKRKI